MGVQRVPVPVAAAPLPDTAWYAHLPMKRFFIHIIRLFILIPLVNSAAMMGQTPVYTIPVVVHIVWHDSTALISDGQVNDQLAILNRDFRRLNCEIDRIESPFATLAADIGFEFCLAQTDPTGQPTAGINRIYTPLDDIGQAIHPTTEKRRIYYTALGGADAWDTERYFNIWVCDMGETAESGFGSRPGFHIPEEDGVLCDWRYFGYTSTPGHGLGRTLTHETGHYFDLVHIWGTTSDCSDDDGIEDTPLQTGPHFQCDDQIALCQGTTAVMSMNFMDYQEDACMAMFTEGQKNRMVEAITGPRQGLIQEPSCATDWDLNNSACQVSPNPAITDFDLISAEPMVLICRVKVYDSSGRLLTTTEPSAAETSIDCRTYPAGLYALVADLSNGKTAFNKVLVYRH